MRPLRLAGLRELQPRLARASLESATCRTGACQHHTVASCGGREKSTGGAGSPVVVGWADLARSAAPRPRPGGLHLRRPNRWLLPLRMAKCVVVRVSDERRRKAECAGGGASELRVRLELPPELKRPRRACLSGSCALDGASALRLGGSSGSLALRPSGRRPGCGFASEHAIAPPTTDPSRGWLRVGGGKPLFPELWPTGGGVAGVVPVAFGLHSEGGAAP